MKVENVTRLLYACLPIVDKAMNKAVSYQKYISILPKFCQKPVGTSPVSVQVLLVSQVSQVELICV